MSLSHLSIEQRSFSLPSKVKFFNQILHIICLVNEFIVSNAAVNDIKLDMF